MNEPRPGSAEEAEARRKAGAGPFSVAKGAIQAMDGEGPMFAMVVDAASQPFAYVCLDHCVGGDLSAAKARATRIAEALDRNEALRAALIKAREIIQMERDTTVECATMPPAHDVATLDDETRPFVEAFDAALAQIDEALR